MKNKFQSILVAVLGILILTGGAFAQKKTAEAQSESVVLQTLDGKTVAAGDLKGRVTVLAIGATWLPLSRQQAIIVNQLNQNYGKRNVAIYFVSTDAADVKSKNYADNAKIKGFADKNKITAAVLRDTDGKTIRFYNLDQIPAFVILNKDGEIETVITGLDTEDDSAKNTVALISKAIDKIL